MEPWNDTFKQVAELTQRVMGWYGFTNASDYRLLAFATKVAVELVERGVTPEKLTREDIENADTCTGAYMRVMWEAVNGVSYSFTSPANGETTWVKAPYDTVWFATRNGLSIGTVVQKDHLVRGDDPDATRFIPLSASGAQLNDGWRILENAQLNVEAHADGKTY